MVPIEVFMMLKAAGGPESETTSTGVINTDTV